MIVLLLLVVIVLAFMVVGLILIFMTLGYWIQKVAINYMKLAELRQLVDEYVVTDLASKEVLVTNPAAMAPPQQTIDAPSASPASGIEIEMTSSPSQMARSRLVQTSVERDLQAIYGLTPTQAHAYAEAMPTARETYADADVYPSFVGGSSSAV